MWLTFLDKANFERAVPLTSLFRIILGRKLYHMFKLHGLKRVNRKKFPMQTD